LSHEKFISFSGIAIVMNTGGRIPTPKKIFRFQNKI